MRKALIYILILSLLLTVLTGCAGNRTTVVKAEKQDRVIVGNTKFALEMFKLLNSEDEDQNIFISPLSISTALTMTLNGASGTTKEAMLKALFYEDLSMGEINSGSKYLAERLKNLDKKVTLDIANSIWVREGYPVKQPFIDINRDMFNAQVKNLDFSRNDATDVINGWIDNATKGLIDKMLEPPIPSDVVMYLINAIYFKGDWTTPFDPKLTYKSEFKGKNANAQVDMMSRKGETEYYENNRLKAVRLPYGKKEAVSMYVILPDESVDIDALIQRLDIDTWDEIRNGLKAYEEVQVGLPKFTMEYGIKELKEALTALGMGEAFSAGADFSGISDGGLAINRVLHKAVIEVHEQGSIAAGVTVVEMRESAVLDAPRFIADRPFLFVIADDTDGSILFMGKMIQ